MNRRARRATASSLPWLLVLLVASVAAAPLALWFYGLALGPRLPKTRLNGTMIPGGSRLTTFVAARARLWEGESITVNLGYHLFYPTRAELGATVDVRETEAQVLGLARAPNPVVAWSAWKTSYFGAGHDVRFRPRLRQDDALDRYANRIAGEVNRAPLPGSYDPQGDPIRGIEGESVDVESLKHMLRRALVTGARQLSVSTFVTPAPPAHRTFVAGEAEESVLMVAQETDYRPGNGGRATNIELAARLLDGHVVMPGAELSFNTVVGKRDSSRGFASALELLNGELVQGVGGGVCQVAGTLHAAAFFAGLEVLEYRPHSRLNQLAYLRPGLDTMVAWPDQARDPVDTKDMRVRNAYPFPIRLRVVTAARAAGQNVLRVELHGAARPFRVDWSFQEVDRVPFSELRREDDTLARGTERVQGGLDGLVIMRRRTVYTPTRRIEEETRVAYPPTPRIVFVGTGP